MLIQELCTNSQIYSLRNIFTNDLPVLCTKPAFLRTGLRTSLPTQPNRSVPTDPILGFFSRSGRCWACLSTYQTLTMKSCQVAFKLTYIIGNMRLEGIEHRLVNGSWVLFNNKVSICKGLVGRHAFTWMEKYFSKQCDIMPTTGRLHLSNNFTHREV